MTIHQDINLDSEPQQIDIDLELTSSGNYHSSLLGRDETNQHPISAIIDLQSSLDSKQNEITISNKLDSDLVDDTNADNKFVTIQEKETWNSKQDYIEDLSTIRINSQAGKDAYEIINTYGNIVTHDVDEFQPAGSYAPAVHTHPISQIINLEANLAGKQNTLIQGTNIIIDGDTISTVDDITKTDDKTITHKDGKVSAIGTYTTNNVLKYDWIGTAQEYQSDINAGIITSSTVCLISDD